MPTPKIRRRFPLVTTLIDNFGFSPGLASVVAAFVLGMCLLALVWVVQSAPPRKLTLASGPEGSSFHRWAGAYQEALAKHGVTLEIVPTSGSLDNLHRLQSPEAKIDIGFVTGGFPKEENIDGLVSLGSISNQPLWIFYRGEAVQRLSQFAGRRLAIGTEGSAARSLSLALLKSNGITGEPTIFSDLDSAPAAEALLAGDIDAVFLIGDSVSIRTLATLVRSPDVRLLSFTQADAYQRRHPFLNQIPLPQGSIDLGKNLPSQNVMLVGPTVELVAREGLHSALSDLLLDVARQVHGKPGLLQRAGEFPALTERDIPLSDDAVRYFKSGKGFFYRMVGSFWVASLINRLLVAVVPLALVIIPAIRLLPIAYRLGIQLKFYRCYRPLLRIEQETFGPLKPDRARELLKRLDEIEEDVNHLKTPASFAERFYWLRAHLLSVRERVQAAAEA